MRDENQPHFPKENEYFKNELEIRRNLINVRSTASN